MIVFKSKLTEGVLLKRYKRFFADVEYVDTKNNKKIQLTIHCPNTGSLKSVIEKDYQHKCWFSLNDDPARKLKGTLEAVQAESGAWVGVNTSWPNKIVQYAAEKSISDKKPHFKSWEKYSFYKSEHKINKESRLDGVFCVNKTDLEYADKMKHFVEIKNVTLARDGFAQFPDAVTERGQKHLRELMSLIDQGHKSELIFAIQRNDVRAFSIAEDIDPTYKKLFDQAVKKGLIVTPVFVEISQLQIGLSQKILPIK